MTTETRVWSYLVDANPIPDVDSYGIDPADVTAYLVALQERSSDMTQLDTKPTISSRSPSPPRGRLVGAAVALVAIVGLGGWLVFSSGDGGPSTEPGAPPASVADPVDEQVPPEAPESPVPSLAEENVPVEEPVPADEGSSVEEIPPADDPAPIEDGGAPVANPYGLPDFSTDLSKVGEALTQAMATYDPEVFLSLFADDAVLRTANETFSPKELRAAGVLDSQATVFQYDRGWARTMNQQQVYSLCEVNGDRVGCAMVMTSDFLAPIHPPVEYQAGIQVVDGQIVLLWLSGGSGPHDVVVGAFQAWTYENYPDEAELMWVYEWDSLEIATAESALLHLELGTEYVESLS